ncbi:MAG: 2-amino-4-hydroxy-6-hydroxymethyldihydropteridine diphosphokinase [Thermoguttaceae bacterium]|nr:2-amino-4-hydroxy-6-hydroxymethyldihydropteridine diphosphokinase [Thermoguttaceae bacterium]MDW8039276.1 2-amino-4-hydroxy-6-hydroxymethyldihydropteridine diphosphokinase [Thermoguttaceae bacterium]
MAHVLIGLGSNLGSREENLRRALDLLDETPGIELRAVSRWLCTRPVGGPAGQPDFLNGAVLVQTSLSPDHLLYRIQEIEWQLGRVRRERWGPRTLDLDILLYEQLVVDSPQLRIPHPAMAWRRFVLEPAAQVAGWMSHPQIGWTVRELFEHLKLAFPYVAITGPYPDLNKRLAQRVAQQTGAGLLCVPGWLKTCLRTLTQQVKDLSISLKECNERGDPVSGNYCLAGTTLPIPQDGGNPRHPEEPTGKNLAQTTQIAQDIVQWLHVLTERLPSYRYRRPLDGWIITDFWLHQWLSEAATVLGPALSEPDRKHWESLSRLIASPKLLVVLTKEGAKYPTNGENEPPYVKVENIRSSWRGPILQISLARGIWPPRLTRAATEVQTAMESMD